MSSPSRRLQAAEIKWLKDGTPSSTRFDDIYYTPASGTAEARHVYIRGNGLEQRFARTRHHFCVGELGFGTGLNFLLCCSVWEQYRPNDSAWLDYVSTEKYPLTQTDLRRAHQAIPELEKLSDSLLENYPPLLTGQHLIYLPQLGVRLHLLFGDALESLRAHRADYLARATTGQVHAWFIDGFAPRKNPELWQQDIWQCIAELSAPRASFASFSVAASVKHAASIAGFSIRKQAGFGKKREMLCGELNSMPAPPQCAPRGGDFPAPSWYLPASAIPRGARVAVLGAGIAGCTTAAALQARGYEIALFEAHPDIAQRASRNANAALYTRLSAHSGISNDFSLSSYLFAAQYYNENIEEPASGLLQLPPNQQKIEIDRYNALVAELDDDRLVQLANAERASSIAGIKVTDEAALYFPGGRSVDVPTFCRRLISRPGIQLTTDCEVLQLQYLDAAAGQAARWRLIGQQQCLGEFAALVVCAGYASLKLPELGWLPLRAMRGQLSELPASATSQRLRSILCRDRYLTPARNGFHALGSSYSIDDEELALREHDHLANLGALSELFAEGWSPQALPAMRGYADVRCTTPDYLPIVGPAPDYRRFFNQFLPLQHDRKLALDRQPALLPGLYINTGLGSRGLCFAPICAEVIASQVSGETSPLPARLRHALLPGRFIVRNIARGHFAQA